MLRSVRRGSLVVACLSAAFALAGPAIAGAKKKGSSDSTSNTTERKLEPRSKPDSPSAESQSKKSSAGGNKRTESKADKPSSAAKKPALAGKESTEAKTSKTSAKAKSRAAESKPKPRASQSKLEKRARTRSPKAQPPRGQSSPEKQARDKARGNADTQPVAAKTRVLPKSPDEPRKREASLAPPRRDPPAARSVSPRLVIPPRDVAERSRAFAYANLEDAAAIAELNRRGIAWVPASPPLPGVRTPIRLRGALRGVTIRSTLPEPERAASAFEILDARLALALDDFCRLLARHDVVELVHYTMYRPPAELPQDLNKQIRHPAGLAIDLGAVRKRDGRWLAVGPHWPSDIGAKTCGEGAREHWSRPGRELVSIACEAADLRLFHFILTPHFDAAHADHLHLEIKPDTRWFIVN